MIRSVLTALFVAVVVGGSWVVYQMTTAAGSSKDVVEVSVERGQGVNQISNMLSDAGLVNNQLIFETLIWLKRSEGKIQAGVYEIPKNITMIELVTLLVGEDIDTSERSITLIEGWTASDMDAYFVREGLFASGEFAAVARSTDARTVVPSKTFAVLADKSSSATLEGYLFPDTYHVLPDVTPEEVVAKMLTNSEKKITSQMRNDIVAQGRTVFEVMTLASIIEREVQSVEDKRNVADVFLKRLRDGIALQSDATVNYVTGNKTTRPSNEDIAVNSLYNTYEHKGLPPGPISNPGLDSINAAIYPATNPYYFFLTKTTGEAVFAKDFAGHQQNRELYLD